MTTIAYHMEQAARLALKAAFRRRLVISHSDADKEILAVITAEIADLAAQAQLHGMAARSKMGLTVADQYYS